MCGIYGYAGSQPNATTVVVQGLTRLEYRGYDSWGVASLVNNTINLQKQAGKISQAKVNLLPSGCAIGHTRWATHGGVSTVNAHPHLATDGSFALAQNGIVENYQTHKTNLINQGYHFHTQTDTEVIVYLIQQQQLLHPDIIQAIRSAFLLLHGRNTIIVITDQGQIIACRHGSPLLIGTNNDGRQIYLSSDSLSLPPTVTQIMVLNNLHQLVYDTSGLHLYDLKSGQSLPLAFTPCHQITNLINKNGFPHFMLKEIYDTPSVIQAVINRDQQEYLQLSRVVAKAERVYTIGSGTAGNAAAQIAYYLRTLAKIPAISLIGAEAQDYLPLITPQDIIIAPSQSGETADVIKILEAVKTQGTPIASYVNMPGSYITRLSDYPCMANAGPEICVASTKIFTSQIAWGYLLAKSVAGELESGIKDLTAYSHQIQIYLNTAVNHDYLKQLAKTLSIKPHLFLLAKGQNLQIINEAMIKIIEEAYLHAHAIPAGDLKHYAITIMAPGVPVIAVVSNDGSQDEVMNAVNQVKARGAIVTLINEGSAICNMIPLQLLAYYLGLVLGHDIDQPRHIAKSVTVL